MIELGPLAIYVAAVAWGTTVALGAKGAELALERRNQGLIGE